RSGATINKTFRAGEKMEQAVIERQKKQFLYRADSTYYFMDLETYEQIPLDVSILGESVKFLKEALEIQFLLWNDSIIGVELPTFIDYKVTYTEPGLRGDTVSGTNKPATIETGGVVQVPLFIEIDDVIRIDTRTGQYIQRV
ncbi:MAG: elongation factor P, partial [bacterium]